MPNRTIFVQESAKLILISRRILFLFFAIHVLVLFSAENF